MAGFRTDVRPPIASSTYSSTSTNLAKLVLAAPQDPARWCVTGFQISWDTVFTTPVQPRLVCATDVTLSASGLTTLAVFQPTTANISVNFTYAICGLPGKALALRTTCSTVSTVNMSLQYFLDNG